MKNLCFVYVFPTKLSVYVKYKDVLWIALEKVFPDNGTEINLFALEGLLAVFKVWFFLPNLSKTAQPLPNKTL